MPLAANRQEMMQVKQGVRQGFKMTKPISNNEKQFTQYPASRKNDCVDYQFYAGDVLQPV
jgi:hypothetical protein